METILKLHPNNIAQLKGHIIKKGASVIHGDGNIYPAILNWTPDSGVMNHSHNNAQLSNPNREEATYHKTYHTIDEVPSTIEKLQDELIAAKFKKAAQERTQQSQVASNTFEAYVEPENENTKAAKVLASLKDKLDATVKKAEEAKVKAEAEGATDKVKKTYEELQAKANELQEQYNGLTA